MAREIVAFAFPESWDDPSVLNVQGVDCDACRRFSQASPKCFVNRLRMMALKRLARKIATGKAKPGSEIVVVGCYRIAM